METKTFVITHVTNIMKSKIGGLWVRVTLHEYVSEDFVKSEPMKLNIANTNPKAVVAFKPYINGKKQIDDKEYLDTTQIVPNAKFEMDFEMANGCIVPHRATFKGMMRKGFKKSNNPLF